MHCWSLGAPLERAPSYVGPVEPDPPARDHVARAAAADETEGGQLGWRPRISGATPRLLPILALPLVPADERRAGPGARGRPVRGPWKRPPTDMQCSTRHGGRSRVMRRSLGSPCAGACLGPDGRACGGFSPWRAVADHWLEGGLCRSAHPASARGAARPATESVEANFVQLTDGAWRSVVDSLGALVTRAGPGRVVSSGLRPVVSVGGVLVCPPEPADSRRHHGLCLARSRADAPGSVPSLACRERGVSVRLRYQRSSRVRTKCVECLHRPASTAWSATKSCRKGSTCTRGRTGPPAAAAHRSSQRVRR
jgi:hypothetical protein